MSRCALSSWITCLSAEPEAKFELFVYVLCLQNMTRTANPNLIELRHLQVAEELDSCFWLQFYDHFFDWGLKDGISALISIRKRSGICATSNVQILASDSDLYIAMIDQKIIVKIGPKLDLGNLIPPSYQVATSGQDYAVWEKKAFIYHTKCHHVQNGSQCLMSFD